MYRPASITTSSFSSSSTPVEGNRMSSTDTGQSLRRPSLGDLRTSCACHANFSSSNSSLVPCASDILSRDQTATVSPLCFLLSEQDVDQAALSPFSPLHSLPFVQHQGIAIFRPPPCTISTANEIVSAPSLPPPLSPCNGQCLPSTSAALPTLPLPTLGFKPFLASLSVDRCFRCGIDARDKSVIGAVGVAALKTFKRRYCKSCQKMELITRAEAREEYLLTEKQLAQLNSVTKPWYNKTCVLYLRSQVEDLADLKWGSDHALAAERERRRNSRQALLSENGVTNDIKAKSHLSIETDSTDALSGIVLPISEAMTLPPTTAGLSLLSKILPLSRTTSLAPSALREHRRYPLLAGSERSMMTMMT
ncbi:hypothetical protein BC829DRAFT_20190 [Chytridium lagenaria]|nr:hypothetical protein BC829DRAFT_20190 [Chytridium lagenaria]